MVSGTACQIEPGGRSSRAAGRRGVPASLRSGTSHLTLRGAHRFDAVFAQGRRVRRGGITVVSGPGPPGPARVGLVAGRRVGNAVVRNRVKRRLRAALAEVELADRTDFVVIGTRRVATVDFVTLVKWVATATGRKETEGE